MTGTAIKLFVIHLSGCLFINPSWSGRCSQESPILFYDQSPANAFKKEAIIGRLIAARWAIAEKQAHLKIIQDAILAHRHSALDSGLGENLSLNDSLESLREAVRNDEAARKKSNTNQPSIRSMIDWIFGCLFGRFQWTYAFEFSGQFATNQSFQHGSSLQDQVSHFSFDLNHQPIILKSRINFDNLWEKIKGDQGSGDALTDPRLWPVNHGEAKFAKAASEMNVEQLGQALRQYLPPNATPDRLRQDEAPSGEEFIEGLLTYWSDSPASLRFLLQEIVTQMEEKRFLPVESWAIPFWARSGADQRALKLSEIYRLKATLQETFRRLAANPDQVLPVAETHVTTPVRVLVYLPQKAEKAQWHTVANTWGSALDIRFIEEDEIDLTIVSLTGKSIRIWPDDRDKSTLSGTDILYVHTPQQRAWLLTRFEKSLRNRVMIVPDDLSAAKNTILSLATAKARLNLILEEVWGEILPAGESYLEMYHFILYRLFHPNELVSLYQTFQVEGLRTYSETEVRSLLSRLEISIIHPLREAGLPFFQTVHSSPLLISHWVGHLVENHIFDQRIEAIERWKFHEEAAITLAKTGAHLRTTNRGVIAGFLDDGRDVYPSLLATVIPHLEDLLHQWDMQQAAHPHKKLAPLEEEIRDYVGAIINGLMIPAFEGAADTSDDSKIAAYKRNFELLAERLNDERGIDVIGTLREARKRVRNLLPQKMPRGVIWTGQQLGSETIEDLVMRAEAGTTISARAFFLDVLPGKRFIRAFRKRYDPASTRLNKEHQSNVKIYPAIYGWLRELSDDQEASPPEPAHLERSSAVNSSNDNQILKFLLGLIVRPISFENWGSSLFRGYLALKAA